MRFQKIQIKNLYKNGENNDNDCGGCEHVSAAHQLWVQWHHQAVTNGASNPTIAHDELVYEPNLLEPSFVDQVGEHTDANEAVDKAGTKCDQNEGQVEVMVFGNGGKAKEDENDRFAAENNLSF